MFQVFALEISCQFCPATCNLKTSSEQGWNGVLRVGEGDFPEGKVCPLPILGNNALGFPANQKRG